LGGNLRSLAIAVVETVGSAFISAREVQQFLLRVRKSASCRYAAEPVRQFAVVGSGLLRPLIPIGRSALQCRRVLRFDSIPTAVKSAPLLGEHTAEVLADWLGLDAAAVAGLRQDGIV
jgi:hypothetical protein